MFVNFILFSKNKNFWSGSAIIYKTPDIVSLSFIFIEIYEKRLRKASNNTFPPGKNSVYSKTLKYRVVFIKFKKLKKN